MTKMKAQATEDTLTATALSSDEPTEIKIVGFRNNDGMKEPQFLTIDEFTGEENEVMISPEHKAEVLSKLAKAVKANKRHRKFGILLRLTIVPVVALGACELIINLLSLIFNNPLSLDMQELRAYFISVAGMMTALIMGGVSIHVVSSLVRKKLPRVELDDPELMEVISAEQGFRSFISGDPFERGAPSHESLFEAIQLLNKASEINKSLTEKKLRQNEFRFVHKSKEIRQEIVKLDEEIESLQSELRIMEADIQELLLREDDEI